MIIWEMFQLIQNFKDKDNLDNLNTGFCLQSSKSCIKKRSNLFSALRYFDSNQNV